MKTHIRFMFLTLLVSCAGVATAVLDAQGNRPLNVGNVDDAAVSRIADALAYPTTVQLPVQIDPDCVPAPEAECETTEEMRPNPESRQAFVQRMIREWLQEQVVAHERRARRRAFEAQDTAETFEIPSEAP